MLILVLFAAGISSCTAMFSSTGTSIITSSYLSEDEAILGAEEQYCEKEAELQDKPDNFERYYPGYDEYNFDLDDIEHWLLGGPIRTVVFVKLSSDKV